MGKHYYDATLKRFPKSNLPTNRVPYLTDSGEVSTYLKYSGDDPSPIMRIQSTGAITEITIAFGEWAKRATLSYIPCNNLLEGEEDDSI